MLEKYTGKCACPGKVSGIAVDSLDDEGILVLDTLKPNEFINPSKHKGMILRRSGLLSHGAIVAREFNVPCLVSSDIGKVTGKKIDLNATDGTITVY